MSVRRTEDNLQCDCMTGVSFVASASTAATGTRMTIQESSQQHLVILELFQKKTPGVELSEE